MCRIAIVFHTKNDGTHQFVVFYEFDITGLKNLFTPSDYLVGTVVVNVFDDVRECQIICFTIARMNAKKAICKSKRKKMRPRLKREICGEV